MATSFVVSNAAAAAQCNAVVDLLDAGTTHPHGILEIHSAAHALLAEIAFANPAFGSATTANPAVATAASLPIAFVGLADGTADHAHYIDRDATVVATADVGLTDATVILDNLSIATSQVGSLTACTVSVGVGT